MNKWNKNLNTSNKAVIYCRVSSKSQVIEGTSLTSQEKMCNDYALHNDYEVINTFIEEGESAKTANRTALNSMLNFCSDKINNVGVVIFYKIDRFARIHTDYGNLKFRLRKMGIIIRSATEPITDTPSGRFMENVIASVAQFDNDMRTERCIAGVTEAMREGRYVWGAPFGYDNIRVIGRANLAPNAKAPFVKKAFEMVAENLKSVEEIRRNLTHEWQQNKIKTISRPQFYRMLKNKAYIGWIEKMGEKHKGIFEPIITEVLFEQVQYVLKHRARRNHQYLLENPDFPLRRFVKHPTGIKLTGSWSSGRRNKYAYYRFKISKMEFPKMILENTYTIFLNCFALNINHIEQLKALLKHSLSKGIEGRQIEAKLLRKTLSELKEKQTILLQKNIDGVISDTVLRNQLEIIEEETFKTNKMLLQIPDLQYDFDRLLNNVVAGYLKDPGDIWDKVPFEIKLKLQWFQFPQGIIFDGEKIGTTKIRSIYMVKKHFFKKMSHHAEAVRFELTVL